MISRISKLSVLFMLIASVAFGDWSLAFKGVGKKIGRLESTAGICSAIVINQGLALTAAHCVDIEKRSDLTFNGRSAELVKANKVLDLAIIRFEPKDEDLMLMGDTPETGMEVAVVGYAFGIKQLVAQFGHVALPHEDSANMLWMNVDTIPGDSGGAVITPEGHLVGVTDAVLASGASHIGLAIPIDLIKDFCKPFLPKVK